MRSEELTGRSVSIDARRGRYSAVETRLDHIDGRPVGLFRLEGGPHRGALGPAEGEAIERLVQVAVDDGLPIVGVVSSSGADMGEGIASLHAWGRVASRLAHASGTVPIILAVIGPYVSGPALLAGMADHVVMTVDAFAYVTGPRAVEGFTGEILDPVGLGGAAVHDARSGVVSVLAEDEDDALAAVADLLAYLPANTMEEPPRAASEDPVTRDCVAAASAVPGGSRAVYDIRAVVTDVVDASSFLEVRARYAPNMVTGYGRLDGRPIGIVANQPHHRAGTIDIEASRKAARFVQSCDAFNIPLLTIVDTPGFEPGKDLEWRGMIRHGAELVFAYGEATVPRLCLVVRKAYGGAYIVMDSRGLGSDFCAAWPGAEIAVMGSKGAVQILFGRRLAALDADAREREIALLEADYEARYCAPYLAAERGYIDDVIDPLQTRRVLAGALGHLTAKREHLPVRRHSNTPL
ncbi:MAG TPA: carboxyl transferase domain-containing protein [Acidimicrobiales bacterium]